MYICNFSAMDQRHFLCYFILTSCLVAGQTPQYGLLGREATLIPSIPAQPEQILWKHDGDKVAEFDGSEEKVYRTYKNRITLNWHSAEITIKDLQHEDSGEYELEAIINKKLIYSRHEVIVIDEVAQPTISCVMNHGNDSPHATLLCSSDLEHRPSVMKFDWGSLGESQGGRELNISLQGRHDDSVYTCRVTNPLSAKNATFTAKDCYPDESSPVRLLAGIVVGLFLLTILICVGLWIYSRRQHHKAQPNIETGDMKKTSSHSRTTEGLVDNQTNSPDDSTEKGNVKEKTKWFEDLNLHGSGDKHGDHGKKTHQREETQPLLDTSATLFSPQLRHGLDQSHLNIEPEDPANKPKVDQVTVTPTEQKLPDSDSWGGNEPDSDGEVRDLAEDKQSDPQLSAAPEQPGSEKKAGDDEEIRTFTLASSQTHSLLTQNDPCMESDETSSEPNEDVETEQVSGKPTEENLPESVSSGFMERNVPDSDGDLKGVAGENQADLQTSAAPEQPGPQMTPPEQAPNPSLEEPKREDTMESNKQKDQEAVSAAGENQADQQPSAAPVQPGPQMTPPEQAPNPSQEEMESNMQKDQEAVSSARENQADMQPSTASEQPGPKITPPEQAPNPLQEDLNGEDILESNKQKDQEAVSSAGENQADLQPSTASERLGPQMAPPEQAPNPSQEDKNGEDTMESNKQKDHEAVSSAGENQADQQPSADPKQPGPQMAPPEQAPNPSQEEPNGENTMESNKQQDHEVVSSAGENQADLQPSTTSEQPGPQMAPPEQVPNPLQEEPNGENTMESNKQKDHEAVSSAGENQADQQPSAAPKQPGPKMTPPEQDPNPSKEEPNGKDKMESNKQKDQTAVSSAGKNQADLQPSTASEQPSPQMTPPEQAPNPSQEDLNGEDTMESNKQKDHKAVSSAGENQADKQPSAAPKQPGPQMAPPEQAPNPSQEEPNGENTMESNKQQDHEVVSSAGENQADLQPSTASEQPGPQMALPEQVQNPLQEEPNGENTMESNKQKDQTAVSSAGENQADLQPSTTSEQPGPQITPPEQAPNPSQEDLNLEDTMESNKQKDHDAVSSAGENQADQQQSAAPKQPGPKMTPPEQDPNPSKEEPNGKDKMESNKQKDQTAVSSAGENQADLQPSTTSEQPGPQITPPEQAPNPSQEDLNLEDTMESNKQKDHEAVSSAGENQADQQPSAAPKQPGPKMTPPEQDPNPSKEEPNGKDKMESNKQKDQTAVSSAGENQADLQPSTTSEQPGPQITPPEQAPNPSQEDLNLEDTMESNKQKDHEAVSSAGENQADQQPSAAPKQPGPQMAPPEQALNPLQEEPKGENTMESNKQKDQEAVSSAGENQADQQPSLAPKQPGSQMAPPEQDPNPSQEEPNGDDTMESNPQKDHQAVSEAEDDSDKVSGLSDAFSDRKVADKPNTANTNQDPPLDTSIEA